MLFLCWELSSPHQPHFIYPLFPACCRADTIHQTSTQPPQLAGDVCSQPAPHQLAALNLGQPQVLSEAAHRAPVLPVQPSHGWDHRSSSCQSAATPQHCWGQEPRQNNGNHLQGRKLHLLDETLSSNKTCLDNSSFITRLFRY